MTMRTRPGRGGTGIYQWRAHGGSDRELSDPDADIVLFAVLCEDQATWEFTCIPMKAHFSLFSDAVFARTVAPGWDGGRERLAEFFGDPIPAADLAALIQTWIAEKSNFRRGQEAALRG